MFDLHQVPAGWGLRPTLLGVSSYGLFILLGIAAGAGYYFFTARQKSMDGEKAAIIVLAALLGGGLGAKIPLLLADYRVYAQNPALLASGKTILGGLLGGFAGVLLAKKCFRIKGRYGNLIAPAAALGVSIGRIGCLLTGCCYGKTAGWGIDFGDGYLRYPTQAFEILFHFCAFLTLAFLRPRVKTPGILFKGYLLSYLAFRYLTEFLRESEILWAGQTMYQWLCIGGILLMAPKILSARKRREP